MSGKVLVIGLDGGTFTILDPLAKKGKLPNMQRIMGSGFCGTLLSTIPPVSAPAWSTFITGKNPGKHGVFQFFDITPNREGKSQVELELRPGTFAIVNASSIKEATLWQIASDAGRKVVIINVPMTYPPVKVNGIMITGMLTPSGASQFTYPPELAKSLAGYEIDLSFEEKDFDLAKKSSLINRQMEILEKRGETSLRLMREYPWDLFMVVFTGTDRLQHRFWRSFDLPGIDSDPTEVSEYGNKVEEYYQKLDLIIGDLMRHAGEDVHTIIISDHGFGPMPQQEVSYHNLLRELGVADYVGSGNWAASLRSFLHRVGLDAQNRQKYLGKVMPRAWLNKAERLGQKHVWSVSQARIVNLHTNMGGIWLNVKGAGSEEGVVESGTHYEEMRDQLITKLYRLEDPETGMKFVSKVFKREEVYFGEHLAQTPDLIFVLNSGYRLSGRVVNEDSLVISREMASPMKQGTHLPEGILMISGEGVRNLRSQTDFKLEDATATILYSLGLPIPTDMDGRVVLDALDANFLQRNPVEFVEISSSSETSNIGVTPPRWETEEDQKSVEERLRSLGYLD